jgi:hypothetical protein
MMIPKRMRPAAAVTLVLLFTAMGSSGRGGQAAEARGKTYPVDSLREDLRILWTVLDEGHGGLERYTPREALKKSFDEAASRLTAPLSEFEFYRLLLPLIAGIKDGHTRLLLSPATQSELLARPVLFPFELRFIEEKTCLFRNLSENREIGDGAEILTINGKPMAAIRQALLPLVCADADIPSRRLRLLENPNSFGQFLAVVLGQTESFRLRFRNPSAALEEEAIVRGSSGADLDRRRRERYPESAPRRPLYELGYRGPTAVITIRGFADDRGGGNVPYPEFIQRSFRELAEKKIGTLIIDVRGNGGGKDEYGRLLFAHFMDQPFLYYRALEMKKNRYDLLKYTPLGRGDGPGDTVRKNARGWYDVIDHPNVGMMKPEPPRFTGRTCILIDGLSFSTTGETTSLFHFHKKAVFLGEECGAGYYGNTSGSTASVTLPRTGLQVRIPLVLYTLAVDGYPKNRGIVPDIAIAPSIEDLLAGRDVVLDRALALLGK